MTYDFRARSDASRIFNTEPSRTKQDFQASCDINNILKKYTRNGINPFVVTANAKYPNLVDVPTYHEAMNIVAEAGNAFASLPAPVRFKFGNEPAQLLDFLADPANRDEAIKLGLVEPLPVQDLNSSLQKNSTAAPLVSPAGGMQPA